MVTAVINRKMKKQRNRPTASAFGNKYDDDRRRESPVLLINISRLRHQVISRLDEKEGEIDNCKKMVTMQ